MTIEGITEQDIANYLAANPAFFERHAELLAAIQFPHPQGQRTISLQERQAQMLRERIKGLERRIIEMIRNGQENIGHFEKLQRWSLQQMKAADPEQLHLQLRDAFLIPGTALRIFGAQVDARWAQTVGESVRQHAEGLTEPYCGVNEGFEAAHWIEGMEGHAASLALVPLRRSSGAVFGLLVLASPDATRYSADKGLEFLLRVGEVASVALERSPRPPMRPEFDAYLTQLRVQRRLAARTLLLYEQALERLLQGANGLGVALEALRPAQARELLADLHAQGLSPRSLALQLSAWRGYYRWLAHERRIEHDPLVGLRAPKSGRPLPKALAVDDAVSLAEQQPDDDALQARDRCLIELLYGTGLRIGEAMALDLQPGGAGFVDLANAELQVLGKGGKRRSLPLGAQALQALQRWLARRAELARPGEIALLSAPAARALDARQARSSVAQAAQAAGLPTHVHPHMLRHSYASHLLQSSGDLRGVQELLGHANISTTQVYTRLDWQHLAKVYDAAHPRAKNKSKP